MSSLQDLPLDGLPLPGAGTAAGSARRGRMRNPAGTAAATIDKLPRRSRSSSRRRRMFSPIGLLGALGAALLLILLWRFLREKKRRKRMLSGSMGEPASILIAVASRPREGHLRKVIRETWASNLDHRSSIRFFVGEPNKSDGPEVKAALDREFDEETDMVALSIYDTYENLTLKTLSIFSWARYNSVEDYILKMDTDVYVKLPELLTLLRTTRREKLYMGSVLEYGKYIPYREGAGKWVISYKDYPNIRWPPYCFGSGYVISTELASVIAECLPKDLSCTTNKSYIGCQISERCPFRPVRFEDVTVGGILVHELTGDANIDLNCSTEHCAKAVRRKYEPYFTHDRRFVNEPWKRNGKHDCGDDFVLFHRVNAEMMTKYYNGKEGAEVSMCSLAPHVPERRVHQLTDHAPVKHAPPA